MSRPTAALWAPPATVGTGECCGDPAASAPALLPLYRQLRQLLVAPAEGLCPVPGEPGLGCALLPHKRATPSHLACLIGMPLCASPFSGGGDGGSGASPFPALVSARQTKPTLFLLLLLQGAVLMTTNCIIEPRPGYAKRIFTTGEVRRMCCWAGLACLHHPGGSALAWHARMGAVVRGATSWEPCAFAVAAPGIQGAHLQRGALAAAATGGPAEPCLLACGSPCAPRPAGWLGWGDPH